MADVVANLLRGKCPDWSLLSGRYLARLDQKVLSGLHHVVGDSFALVRVTDAFMDVAPAEAGLHGGITFTNAFTRVLDHTR